MESLSMLAEVTSAMFVLFLHDSRQPTSNTKTWLGHGARNMMRLTADEVSAADARVNQGGRPYRLLGQQVGPR